ncbi:hypothetical protein L873DRAFT_1280416 [Choiromyces venosus 120613-1]|uniref:Uncharacterized protein n=1 Tax=Choiromyces venosus 120613-1 TaxID=1336337 RepID=A0A3N4K8E8_9PEZI|nr:hypothetical protein L873DRAFT_1280416 [Choiromyces venosus 120613-1]
MSLPKKKKSTLPPPSKLIIFSITIPIATISIDTVSLLLLLVCFLFSPSRCPCFWMVPAYFLVNNIWEVFFTKSMVLKRFTHSTTQ